MRGARRLRDLHFRATPAQVDALEARARATCRPLAEVLREALGWYLTHVPAPPESSTGLMVQWPPLE